MAEVKQYYTATQYAGEKILKVTVINPKEDGSVPTILDMSRVHEACDTVCFDKHTKVDRNPKYKIPVCVYVFGELNMTGVKEGKIENDYTELDCTVYNCGIFSIEQDAYNRAMDIKESKMAELGITPPEETVLKDNTESVLAELKHDAGQTDGGQDPQ